MLLPDNIYRRIPQFWMLICILFLLLGASAGSDVDFLPAYFALGVLCIARSIWIYQARWQFHRRNEMKTMHSTQIIDRAKIEDPSRK